MNNFSRGIATIELLIASCIAIIAFTAFLSAELSARESSHGSVYTLAFTQNQAALERAEFISSQSFLSLATSLNHSCASGVCSTTTLSLPQSFSGKCMRSVIASTTLLSSYAPYALQAVATATVFDIPEVLAEGGACDTLPPKDNWGDARLCAEYSIAPQSAASLKVFESIVYLGISAPPYLLMIDSSQASLNCAAPILIANSYSAPAILNNLSVFRARDNHLYLLGAVNTPTNQLLVLDVTDPHAPFVVTQKSLSGASGSYPQGWHVDYYDNKIYILSRETAGPEFHVFSAATPGIASSIIELGSFALNRTGEAMTFLRKSVGGTMHTYAALASDKNSAELSLLDVTDPAHISEITSADQDLPGNQDGSGIYIFNTTLYIGRLSVATGSDLYAFDATTPESGFKKIADTDVQSGVLSMSASGNYVFLVTAQANKELKIWHADTSNFTSINATIALAKSATLISYDDNTLFTAGGSAPLRLIKSLH